MPLPVVHPKSIEALKFARAGPHDYLIGHKDHQEIIRPTSAKLADRTIVVRDSVAQAVDSSQVTIPKKTDVPHGKRHSAFTHSRKFLAPSAARNFRKSSPHTSDDICDATPESPGSARGRSAQDVDLLSCSRLAKNRF